ncbi:MAG: hypothetical protein GOV02_03000 [Candidatus Aenigmarchaeota archaeon]|nr:hypothetical protein [Candidatus Aenigmarchaeota archaeon]
MMTNCRGCSVEKTCFHVCYGINGSCPCHNCIVKVMCKHDKEDDCTKWIYWNYAWRQRYKEMKGKEI